ncbi:hypothetical protein ACFV9D_24790 [Streptomyces sp. NPDC059875]|uniref:hypothetical protein n=1 Tax=unclassified Streptomyces TaxID=2593676 RepID=UPI00365F821A
MGKHAKASAWASISAAAYGIRARIASEGVENNQHANARAAGTVQHAAADVVIALMLVVSVMREIDDHDYAVQHA